MEAILFNREDLEKPIWDISWKNVEKAGLLYKPENISFHFPVNDSDYVEDTFVSLRLQEALQRATDLGLHGVVVHSNRVRPLNKWKYIDIADWRKQVANKLNQIRELVPEDQTWLALENMPIMDNHGKEIDPLFVFPSDFILLVKSRVKVVWDICHFTNTFANLKQLSTGIQNKEYYPNVKPIKPFDFVEIAKQIVHWHFSSFLGVANPDTGLQCREGILPCCGELDEEIYVECLKHILSVGKPDQHIVFEIQEQDYTRRLNAEKMLQWTIDIFSKLMKIEKEV